MTCSYQDQKITTPWVCQAVERSKFHFWMKALEEEIVRSINQGLLHPQFAPENKPEGNYIVFQPSICRGELLVSGRVKTRGSCVRRRFLFYNVYLQLAILSQFKHAKNPHVISSSLMSLATTTTSAQCHHGPGLNTLLPRLPGDTFGKGIELSSNILRALGVVRPLVFRSKGGC